MLRRALLIPSLILFCQAIITAQSLSSRKTLHLEPPSGASHRESPVYAVPSLPEGPFLSFFIVWEGKEAGFDVRFSNDGREWSSWHFLPRDQHNPEKRITAPFFTGTGRRFFQVRDRGGDARALTCHFFSPGYTPAIFPLPQEAAGLRTGGCPLPSLVTRPQWCPGNACPQAASPSTTEVTHLIIHHSAGVNAADDWAAVVRSIWDHHVNGNGWADIGYNYLVDPDGVIYEGRGNDILGAHFCGTNRNTMGICVLGNFQETTPTDAAVGSLIELAAWKLNERQLDPQGSAFHPSSGLVLSTISGHRDGCATSCPGDRFYPLLPEVRSGTAAFLELCRGDATGSSAPGSATLQPSPRLFPNPAGEALQIEIDAPLSGDLTVELFDLSGHRRALEHFRKAGQPATFLLPLNNLPPGLYFLRLHLAGQLFTKKIIRQ